MIIPKPISTRFSAVSRSKGQQIAARLSYITGTDLHSQRTGECHYNSRDDVFIVGVKGWRSANREDLQRLVDAIEAAEGPRKNAREGQSIIAEVLTLAMEQTDARVARLMDIERRDIIESAAEWMRRETGAVVVYAGHNDPLAPDSHPREVQRHAHFGLSRQRVDFGSFRQNIETFSSMRQTGAFMDRLREYLCERYNAAAERYGAPERWTPHGYADAYAALNKERERLGVEPLEVPEARAHEGMAGTAVRRKRARAEQEGIDIEVPCSDLLAQKLATNDAIAARNAAIMDRNLARIARDEQLIALHPRLQAQDERERMREAILARGDYGPSSQERPRFDTLAQARGDFGTLVSEVQALPHETRSWLMRQYPDAILAITLPAYRRIKAELEAKLREGRRGRGGLEA